jgi:hypothetical protein
MAATVVSSVVANPTGLRMAVGSVTLDSSYPTGGYALTPANFGLPALTFVIATAPGFVCRWSKSTQKLLLYATAAAATGITEVTAATNLSTVVVDVLALFSGDGFSGA